MSTLRMPIMKAGFTVPFSALDEYWANVNHGQSLARLAERGGLGACEAIAIVDKRRWRRLENDERVVAIVRLFELSRSDAGADGNGESGDAAK